MKPHRRSRPLSASAAVLGLALLSGYEPAQAAGPVVDIQWSAEGRFEHQSPVAPGKFVELCGALPAGASVRWRFEASAPLDFNIHYHAGKDVVFPTKLAPTTAAQDTLGVKLAQDYCWMWTNKGSAPVNLAVELRR